MSGMQHIPIQQNGKTSIKALLIISLVLMLTLSSCTSYWFVGDGKGDWSFELIDGYYITKVNSREILITYKENIDQVGSTIVLPKYFVIAYQITESYILLDGIKTEGNAISDLEFKDMLSCYYIISTKNHEILGPFNSYDEFYNKCEVMKIQVTDNWVKTS